MDPASGAIRGTPVAAGTFTFTVRVMDSRSTISERQTAITVIALPLVIVTSSVPIAVAGSAYSQQLAASGGLPPYAWSISSGTLPAGLTLDVSTGLLTGTPTDKGTFTFVVSIADQAHSTVTKSLSLAVVGANSVPQVGGAKYKAGGRKLIVKGQNFDPAAILVVDDSQVADRFDGANLIAKPIDLAPGPHTVRVVNPNGASSNTVTLTVN